MTPQRIKLLCACAFVFSTASTVFAEDPFTDVEWDYIGDGVVWEDATAWRVIDRTKWSPSTTISSYPDNTSRVAIDKDLSVDNDRTVSTLMTSYDTPVRTLTIGSANTITVNSLYGSDVINIRCRSDKVIGGLTIDDGNLYLTKTQDKTKNYVNGAWDGTWTITDKTVGTNTISIGLTENSSMGTNIKTVTFGKNLTVTSTENVKISGQSTTQSFVNMQGAYTSQYNNVYKSLYVLKSTLNIESTANVKIGALTVDQSVMNVDGLLQIAPTGLASGSNSAYVSAKSTLNINNKLTLTASGTNTSNLTMYGNVNINKGGSLNTKGGYGNVNVNSGAVLRLASDPGTFSCGSSIRLGVNGKVIFDTPDVWVDGGDGSNARSYSLWMSSQLDKTAVGMSYIDVNAHTYFRGMSFGVNSADRYGAQLTITFGDDPNAILDLEYLTTSCDTNQGYLYNTDSKLVLINFENGKIRMSKGVRSATGDISDNLNLITAEGFEDGSFRIEKWEDNYYYLVGTEVPEPAAIASIFGGIALLLALRRRRNG